MPLNKKGKKIKKAMVKQYGKKINYSYLLYSWLVNETRRKGYNFNV